MTSPSDEPTAKQPPTPAEPANPEAAQPAPAHQPMPYAYPDTTFAPVARPARAPWVNPAKRAPVAIAAGAAALVLLGAGFAAGYAAGHDNRDRVGPVRYMPYDRDHPQMPMNPNFPYRHGPYGPLPSPSPSPSTSG